MAFCANIFCLFLDQCTGVFTFKLIRFLYTVVANFRKKMFEVLCPNNRTDLIADEAQLVIKNFKAAFKLAYKRSQLNVTDMGVSFRSVCSSTKE